MLVAPPIEKFLLRLDEKYARSIKGKVEETDFTTIHSENNKIEDLRIYGAELKQEVREGYNNLNLTKLAQPAIEKVTVSNKKENEITLTSAETPKEKVQQLVRFRLNLKKGTHYLSLKCEGLDGTELVKGISFGLCKTDFTQNVTVSVLDSKKITYTLNEDSEVFLTFVLVNINETDVINTLRKVRFYDIMISDKNADYESYGVSPSMEYPSEVEIKSQELSDCGKNTFNIDEYPLTEKIAYNENGESQWWSGYFGISKYFPVNSEKQYAVSNDLNLPLTYLVFYNNNKEIIKTITGSRVFTTPKDCKFIRFSIQTEVKPSWLQIEFEKATNYEHYKGLALPIALPEGQFNGSMGEVKDCIRKIDDRWKLEKKLYKYEFTGDENIDIAQIQEYYKFAVSINNLKPNTNDETISNIKCNLYKADSISNIRNGKGLNRIGVTGGNPYGRIEILSDVFNTSDDFKAKLKELYQSGEPMYVIYALAESEYIDLPEETQRLLNELEILIGVNNISIDNGTFSFRYNKDLAIELENLQSQIDELKKKIATQVAEGEE